VHFNSHTMDEAGAKGFDEPDYGTIRSIPPKVLEKMFGTDIIPRNLDDPTDGVFEVIKDQKKGIVLCVRNPRSGRWLRYDKGTAQRLIDEAQNAVVQDVPTLLPIPIKPRRSTRKRKRDDDVEQEDVGEPAQAVKKDRVREKKDAKKNWRVAGTAVRFSLRARKQQTTRHTGLSMEFDMLDI